MINSEYLYKCFIHYPMSLERIEGWLIENKVDYIMEKATSYTKYVYFKKDEDRQAFKLAFKMAK